MIKLLANLKNLMHLCVSNLLMAFVDKYKLSKQRIKRCNMSIIRGMTFRPWSTPTAGAGTTGWWTWALTAIFASATAGTGSSRGPSPIHGIESCWSFVKARLHQFKGVPKHPFSLHLKESGFRLNHRYEDLHKLLLKLLRQQPL